MLFSLHALHFHKDWGLDKDLLKIEAAEANISKLLVTSEGQVPKMQHPTFPLMQFIFFSVEPLCLVSSHIFQTPQYVMQAFCH